eukprot:Em0009g1299a
MDGILGRVLWDPVDVTYVDDQIIVVSKPCSIPVHPVGRYKRNTILSILEHEQPHLLAENKQLRVVHRLDRLVSGKVTKEYVARVKGIFPRGRVEVCDPIRVLQDDPLVCGICPEGKPAMTVFEREAILPNQCESLVRCRPITGRLHQIRVHLKALGHPIVNDIRYGGTSANPRQVTPIPPTEDIMYTPLHSSIPSVPDPVDYTKMQWCEECEAGTRDTSSVNRDDLASTSICLHALSYACNQPMHRWRFEVPRPHWAI